MISRSAAGGAASGYAHNGPGHLVGKSAPDAEEYVLDYGLGIAGNGAKHVYGIGRVSRTIGGITQARHNNRLGGAEKLADLGGSVAARVEYDEWGAPNVVEPGLNPSYTGHEWDPVLGVYYAKARFYDPGTRRLLEADPAAGAIGGPQTLAQYVYCLDNPFAYVDPDGKDAIWIGSSNYLGV
jgi:RHS repeat-associated protein